MLECSSIVEIPMSNCVAIPVMLGTSSKAVKICVDGLKPSRRSSITILSLTEDLVSGIASPSMLRLYPVSLVSSTSKNAPEGNGSMQCM